MSQVPTIVPQSEAPTANSGGLPLQWSDIDPAFWWLSHRATGWQVGESGMVNAIVQSLGIVGGTAIECGAGDDSSLPLTCRQLLMEGWRGILVEGDKTTCERLAVSLSHKGITNVNIVCNLIAPNNVNELIEAAGGKDADLLVLDIDSFEYHILAAMTTRPKILCVEHHDMADPKAPKDVPEIEECGRTTEPSGFRVQAPYEKTRELVESMGYTCVGKTRFNGIYVLNELCERLAEGPNAPGNWPCPEKPNCVIVLSKPRVGFVDHGIKLSNACAKLGFRTVGGAGVFWDRDMSCVTEKVLRDLNPDFIIYIDYDTMFEVEDVEKLLAAINSDPDMGCIGSVQMSRHDDRPLVFDAGLNYREPDGSISDVTRVTFQHFGLTIIRRQVFEMLPKPWFWSVPNLDSSWSANDRIDADIWFWRACKEAGIKVCQHNKVVVGHMVLAVKLPGPKGVRLLPIENYERTGMPKDCVFNPDLYMPKPTPPHEPAPEAPPAPKTE